MRVSGALWRFCGKFILSAAALVVILHQVEADALLSRVLAIRAELIPAIAMPIAIQYFLWALRWRYILRRLGTSEVRLGTLLHVIGASSFYGQILPSSIGGDLLRTGMIGRCVGYRQAVMSVIVDRLSGLAVLGAWVALALPPIAAHTGADATVVMAAEIVFVLAAVGAVLLERSHLLDSRILERLWPNHYPDVVRDVAVFLAGRAPGVLMISSAAMHLTSVLLFFAIGRAISVPLDLGWCALLFPVALLASALPISLAGWGLREGAAIGIFSLVGVSAEDALATSILFGLTVPLAGLAVMLLRLARQRGAASMQLRSSANIGRHE